MKKDLVILKRLYLDQEHIINLVSFIRVVIYLEDDVCMCLLLDLIKYSELCFKINSFYYFIGFGNI